MHKDSFGKFLKSDIYKNASLECSRNNVLPIELINNQSTERINKPNLPTIKKQRRKSLTLWPKKTTKYSNA